MVLLFRSITEILCPLYAEKLPLPQTPIYALPLCITGVDELIGMYDFELPERYFW